MATHVDSADMLFDEYKYNSVKLLDQWRLDMQRRGKKIQLVAVWAYTLLIILELNIFGFSSMDALKFPDFMGSHGSLGLGLIGVVATLLAGIVLWYGSNMLYQSDKAMFAADIDKLALKASKGVGNHPAALFGIWYRVLELQAPVLFSAYQKYMEDSNLTGSEREVFNTLLDEGEGFQGTLKELVTAAKSLGA